MELPINLTNIFRRWDTNVLNSWMQVNSILILCLYKLNNKTVILFMAKKEQIFRIKWYKCRNFINNRQNLKKQNKIMIYFLFKQSKNKIFHYFTKFGLSFIDLWYANSEILWMLDSKLFNLFLLHLLWLLFLEE
jgi:hypothetical protein